MKKRTYLRDYEVYKEAKKDEGIEKNRFIIKGIIKSYGSIERLKDLVIKELLNEKQQSKKSLKKSCN